MIPTHTKPDYLPARKLLPDRLQEVMDKFVLRDGTGAMDNKIPPDKKICIMEATAYILGYDEIRDTPPCTSVVIRDLMIGLNDNWGARKRQKLKDLIPYIINTAPTKYNRNGRLVQNESDPGYQEAEATRHEMLDALKSKRRNKNGGWRFLYAEDVILNWTAKKACEFIRQLADVARFDSTPIESDSKDDA